MLLSKPFIVIGLIAALSIFSACAATPELDRNWGKAYEAQKSNQIINPEAGENLEPVTGLDGQVAKGILETYEKQTKEGAEKRPAATSTIFDMGASGSQ
jgi:hypothetical protein